MITSKLEVAGGWRILNYTSEKMFQKSIKKESKKHKSLSFFLFFMCSIIAFFYFGQNWKKKCIFYRFGRKIIFHLSKSKCFLSFDVKIKKYVLFCTLCYFSFFASYTFSLCACIFFVKLFIPHRKKGCDEIRKCSLQLFDLCCCILLFFLCM